MSDKKLKLDPRALVGKVTAYAAKLQKYGLIGFVCLVALIYGFVFYRIHSLSNIEPAPSDVSQQVKAAQIPHVDEEVVKQLESLQDNSVSVQTLFEEARSNPFQ